MRLGAAWRLGGMWGCGCFLTSILQGVFVKKQPQQAPLGWRGADGLGGRAAGADGPLCGQCWGDREAAERARPSPRSRRDRRPLGATSPGRGGISLVLDP